MKNTCEDCEQRDYPYCYEKCMVYAEMRRKTDLARKNREKEAVMNGVQIEGMERSKWR